jgi:hypothetical protein
VAAGLGVDPATKTCTGPTPHPGPAPSPPTPKPVVPSGTCSGLMDGMSLVYGDKRPVGDYPTTDTAAACEALCKANHTCTYGTWHDEHQGRYKNRCLTRTDGEYKPHRQGGHTSFLCNMTGTVKRTADKHPDEIERTFEPQRRAGELASLNCRRAATLHSTQILPQVFSLSH